MRNGLVSAARIVPFLAATTVHSLSTTKAPTLTAVQSTSLLVAFWRELETRREDGVPPLIRDEPATFLLDSLLSPSSREEYEASPVKQIGWNVLAVRTRVIDDWLLQQGFFENASISSRKPRQIVNLGAGMCSRPYRLPFDKNAVIFEVDSDLALLEKKRSVLETAAGFNPRCGKVVDVVGDLSDAKSTALALKKAGLDPNVQTDWIAEGIFEYLDPCYHAPILEMAQTTAPGSRMAFQFLEQPVKDHFENLGVHLPWKQLVNTEIIAKEASSIGWEKVAVLSEGDLAKIYDREVNLPGFNMVFLDSAISN